jgi:hypothetical protein
MTSAGGLQYGLIRLLIHVHARRTACSLPEPARRRVRGMDESSEVQNLPIVLRSGNYAIDPKAEILPQPFRGSEGQIRTKGNAVAGALHCRFHALK